jgi:hypothetical protein
MSEGLFSRNLAYFRQELRDLKTSHAIAVGSLDFYKNSASAYSTGYFGQGIYVRITIKAGEPANPYAQVFIRKTDDARFGNLLQYQSIENDGTIIQYYFLVSEGTYEASAICTSDFDIIVKQYQDGDWIGEEPI